MSAPTSAPALSATGSWPSIEPESVVRLLESATQVRRRFQFFIWLQSHLQAVLPHQLAVCGSYQRASRALQFEVFNTVVLPPAAQAVLTAPASPLLRAAVSAWVAGQCRPLRLALDELSVAGGAEAGEGLDALQALGLRSVLLHGVSRPTRPADLETFFLLGQPVPFTAAGQLAQMELLMPYLHTTYQRVQAMEQGLQPLADRPGAPPALSRRATLTARECTVLRGVRTGLSNQQIASVMSISPLTVKNHVQKILRKLGASNRAQAVARGMDLGLLDGADDPVRAGPNGLFASGA